MPIPSVTQVIQKQIKIFKEKFYYVEEELGWQSLTRLATCTRPSKAMVCSVYPQHSDDIPTSSAIP